MLEMFKPRKPQAPKRHQVRRGDPVSRETLIDLFYLFSATTFLVALKGLGSPKHARTRQHGRGLRHAGRDRRDVLQLRRRTRLAPRGLILLAMFIGVIIAVPTARFVKMTAMPQLVAIFNGVGGGAASLVSITEFVHIKSTHPATYVDPRGPARRLDRHGFLCRLGDRLREAPGAHDRSSGHLPRPADHQRRRWRWARWRSS